MAHPTYNETDFTSVANHELDITVTTHAAGTFTVHLDGGPYTGSGGDAEAVRDALKADIDGGTHPGWTASNVSTDTVRLTSVGPGQHIGGGEGFINPAVEAPAGGVLTLSDNVPFVGVDTAQLRAEIEVSSIATKLLPDRQNFSWLDLNTVPRVLEIAFEVDPLPGGEKTTLDGIVANYTGFDAANFLTQFIRTVDEASAQGGVVEGANRVLATKGLPDGGIKILNLTGALGANAQDIALTNTATIGNVDTTPVKVNYDVIDNAGDTSYFSYAAGTITIDKACRLKVWAGMSFERDSGMSVIGRIAIYKNGGLHKQMDSGVDNVAGTDQGYVSIGSTLSLVPTDTIEIFVSTLGNRMDVHGDQNCMTAVVLRGE